MFNRSNEVPADAVYHHKNGAFTITLYRDRVESKAGLGTPRKTLPLNAISSVETNRGTMLAKVVLRTSTESVEILFKNREARDEFVTALNGVRSAPAAPPPSAADELAKWKGLLDSGVISAADFEAKKAQLLGL
jgi:hypothetical protein